MKSFAPQSEWPLIFLSGFSPTGIDTNEWLDVTKCKARCLSFAYTCPGAFYYLKREKDTMHICNKRDVRIMMDSGAFSFQKFVRRAELNAQEKFGSKKVDVDLLRTQTIDLYVDFCKEYGKVWDFYVNFDYRLHSPTIWKVQKELEKRGIAPVPVFHGDVDISWLDRYKGYPLICAGTLAFGMWKRKGSYDKSRYYYDAFFNWAAKHGTKLHALAVTSLSLMFQYPWYSVDSATWAKVAAVGCIVHIDHSGNVLSQVHVSKEYSKHDPSYARMSGGIQREIREQVERNGFDFEKIRTWSHHRALYNAYMFTNHIKDLKMAVERTRVQWASLL